MVGQELIRQIKDNLSLEIFEGHCQRASIAYPLAN
jgi:hypothetical protein